MQGESSSPYDSFNLATHVDDDLAAVLKNRAALSQELGIPLQFMNQVHGSEVLRVNSAESDPTADALITTTPGLGLAVLVADCIPLLMWDSQNTVVAAVHVGRRGAINGLVRKVVAEMRSLSDGKIHSTIGPHICANCYVVGVDVAGEFEEHHPGCVRRHATLTLDLAKALSEELASLSIDVDRVPGCTVEDSTLYSYRRDGITGRFAGVIAIAAQ